MENKVKHILYITLVFLILNGCKSLNTNTVIQEKEMPLSFQPGADTNSIAAINWREYFGDEFLIKLIDTALTSNLDLKITLQRIQSARAGVTFSKGEVIPKVDGNISVGSTRYGKYTESGQGNVTTPYPDDPNRVIPNPVPDYFAGITTSWEVDVWGKLRNKRKAALANYLASIEGKNFVVSNLVADIAVAYYELLALDNEMQILQQTIKKQQEALEIVRFQKETGKTNELAVQQFQILLLNSQLLEKETLQQISETENKINFLLGRYPQPIERRKEVLFEEVPKQISTGIPSLLLTNRPDIREAELLVKASNFDLKAAKASFFPNINITAGIGLQSFNPQFFLNPTSLGYNAAGGLLSPLLNRNTLKAQFQMAKANQITAIYTYQKSIINGFVEVANLLSSIHQLQEVYLLKMQQRDVLGLSVETSTELYKSARANYLEVLLVQQNSLQTQLELVAVNKRQRIAIVNIYKALGGGWK